MSLVIVESPVKGKTIEKFLGSGYRVLSTYGHIRDLPKGELGVDTENDFEPRYVIPTKSRKIINLLKGEVKKSHLTILATDSDREGEAIAWHLVKALGFDEIKNFTPTPKFGAGARKSKIKNIERIVFQIGRAHV